MDLPISLFLLYRRDAWIYNNMRTEQGRKFLEDLWRLQQTQADIPAIRRHIKKGGGN